MLTPDKLSREKWHDTWNNMVAQSYKLAKEGKIPWDAVHFFIGPKEYWPSLEEK